MFSQKTIHDIKRHAIADFPKESIGLVVDGAYRPLENIAENPLDEAMIDEREALELGNHLNAIVHSHPSTPDCVYPNIPSVTDQRSQLAFGVPFGIVVCNEQSAANPFWWGDQVPKAPWTKPRGFHWIVADCYEFIRDIYWQQLGIRLKNFVREWGEWEDSPEHPARSGYVENFADAGFVEVDHPEPYDLGLLRFTDVKVISHAGVLLEGNFWAHHIADAEDPVNPERLSTIEPLGRWGKYVDPRKGGRWLRYVGARR